MPDKSAVTNWTEQTAHVGWAEEEVVGDMKDDGLKDVQIAHNSLWLQQ